MTVKCDKCEITFLVDPKTCNKCSGLHFLKDAFVCKCGHDNRPQVLKAFANIGLIFGADDGLDKPRPCGN